MKSATGTAKTAIFVSLCLLALAGKARAAIEPPQIAPDTAPQTAPNDSAMSAKPAIVSLLEAAVDGLEMPSETDAPFQVVFFESAPEKGAAPQKMKDAPPETTPGKPAPEKPLAPQKMTDAPQKMTAEQCAKLAGAPDDAEIETRDLDEFFEVAATEEEWMNDEERALAQRFAALLKTLKTQLKDAQVIVWGDAEKKVAIIGTCEGGAAGVTTIVVET